MKNKVNIPVIAISAVAVCLVGIAGFLGLKASGKLPASDSVSNSVGNNSNYYSEQVPTTSPIVSIIETTHQVATDTFVPSTQATTQKSDNTTTTKKPTTTQATSKPTTTKPVEETTNPVHGELNPDEMEEGKAYVPVTPSKNLPKDMTFAGLYSQGYDVIGMKPYIYNDDKDPNCFQRKFGYNPTYDASASLIDFTIETTRLDFDYDGKEYRIQLWKGQYISGDIGTVGGEIGVYTRKPGTGLLLDHYNCADEEDWLKMEMTVFWNEFDDGVYRPQFTCNYNDFWWATGFVDGQLKDRFDSNDLKLMGRITFESEEQAQAFAGALDNNGFTKVSTFNPNQTDVYKIYSKDVIFMWQYIR